jgi:Flp pilus assembly protein TadD
MYVATAYAAVTAGDRAEAEGRLLEALEGNANLVPAHSLYGQLLAMGGRCDQGIHELELAYTLSPRDPGVWSVLMTTALAHFAAGRYDSAVEWARRAVTKRPHVPFVYAALAASLALRGDVAEARDALAHVARRNERLDLGGIGAVVGSTAPDILERFIAGLRLAGMPAR